MSAVNNGGAAFPVASPGGSTLNQGMSLRDYFAAKAMHALIVNQSADLLNGCGWDHIIAGAYQAADKMLAQRATPSTTGGGNGD